MEKRMTKKECFGVIRDLLDNFLENGNAQKTMLMDFVDHEIELLDNKASRHTLTKTQKENEELKDLILKVLTEKDVPMTIADIQLEDSELANKTNQKISALLKQLVDNGLVKRVPDKKKTLFQRA